MATPHRLKFPAVDTARFDEATYGSIDTDGRWAGETSPVLQYPNTMGQPRGLMVGKVFTGAKASDFCGLAGSGSTRANTRAAQKYNDGCSTYEGVQ